MTLSTAQNETRPYSHWSDSSNIHYLYYCNASIRAFTCYIWTYIHKYLDSDAYFSVCTPWVLKVCKNIPSTVVSCSPPFSEAQRWQTVKPIPSLFNESLSSYKTWNWFKVLYLGSEHLIESRGFLRRLVKLFESLRSIQRVYNKMQTTGYTQEVLE